MRERGLVTATEYHKRFDDRSLIARHRYRTFSEADRGYEEWIT
jgi:hypothetical protein